MSKLPIFVVFLFAFSVTVAQADEQAVPSPPVNLVAYDVSSNQIDLYWNAPEDTGGLSITGYKIEAKRVPGNYYVEVSDTGNNQTSYSHTGLQTGMTYIYRIYAINDEGLSEVSGEALAKPDDDSTPPEQIVPNKPIALIATDISSNQIELEWGEPSENDGPPLLGYKIERKINSEDYVTLVNNTSSISTTFLDDGLTTDTSYTYRVYAINSIGESNPSNTDSATPKESSTPPIKDIVPNSPRNLQAESLSPTEIFLSWDEPNEYNGPPIIAYMIEVSENAGSYYILTPDNGLQKTFTHTGLNSGSIYSYRVSAMNSVGTSASSSTDTAKPEHTLVPTQFAVAALSSSSVDFSWNPPSQTYGQDITEYEIQQEIGPAIYHTISKTDGDDATFTLENLEPGVEYTFVVVANYLLGSSDVSKEVSITLEEDFEPESILTVPSAPIGLKATAKSSDKITLSWNTPKNIGNSEILGYKIEAKAGTSSTYSVIEKNTKSTLQTYHHTDRNPNTTYTYKISAINSVGIGSTSNEASAKTYLSSPISISGTAPLAPTSLSAISDLPTQIHLSWKKPINDGGSKILGYKIEVKYADSENFVTLTSNVAKTSYEHTGLIQNSSYTYKISAINSIGTGNYQTVTTNTISDDPKLRIPGFPDPQTDPQSYIDRYNNEPSYKEWFDSNFPDYTIYEVVGLPEPKQDPKLRIPGFPDPQKDPQSYIDRYNNEPSYKEWFDSNFPDYTIYEVVGLPEPKQDPKLRIPGFPDPQKDPQSYIDRYNNEPSYKEWFDSNFPDYTIYEVVGVEPQVVEMGLCVEGTKLIDGVCTVVEESQNEFDLFDTSSAMVWITPILSSGIIIVVLVFRRR